MSMSETMSKSIHGMQVIQELGGSDHLFLSDVTGMMFIIIQHLIAVEQGLKSLEKPHTTQHIAQSHPVPTPNKSLPM